MKKVIGFAILLAAFASASQAQEINVVKLDSFLNILASKNMANGSLAISKNGVIKYQKAVGYSLMAGDKKIVSDVNTKYRIGSATKMFTAAMIFQLLEEGKIELDQKLSTYFHELANADRITIQDMLYHRSGLHDYTRDTDFQSWRDKPKSPADLLKIIKEKGSDFEPGAKADYSNSNYLLLGYIIESICKMSYAEVLQKRITSKLNLKNTYFGGPVNISNKESLSYKYASGNWIKEKETDLAIHGGAGSIVSTPADMVSFMNALFSDKLVSSSSVLKMQTMLAGYGMGLFSNKYGRKPSFGHNGRIEEFYSATWYFPEEKLSFAYCTNGINYPRTDLIEGILKICFNERFVIPFTNTDFLNRDLEKYPGRYSSDQIIVDCKRDGEKLLLETGGNAFEVEKIGDNYFMNALHGYFFEFFPELGELQIKETDNIYYLKKLR